MNFEMGTHWRMSRARCDILLRILAFRGERSGRVRSMVLECWTCLVIVLCRARSICKEKFSKDLTDTESVRKIHNSCAMEYLLCRYLARGMSLFMTALLQRPSMQSRDSGMSSNWNIMLRARLAISRITDLYACMTSKGLALEDLLIKDVAVMWWASMWSRMSVLYTEWRVTNEGMVWWVRETGGRGERHTDAGAWSLRPRVEKWCAGGWAGMHR